MEEFADEGQNFLSKAIQTLACRNIEALKNIDKENFAVDSTIARGLASKGLRLPALLEEVIIDRLKTYGLRVANSCRRMTENQLLRQLQMNTLADNKQEKEKQEPGAKSMINATKKKTY